MIYCQNGHFVCGISIKKCGVARMTRENGIVAIVLTSKTKQNIVTDAIVSCIEWVDIVLTVVIPQGDDETLDVIKSLSGEKYRQYDLTESEYNAGFAEWRNTGLREAEKYGNWGMQLDTDERIVLNGFDIRSFLFCNSNNDIPGFVVYDQGIIQQYDKPRFFKLPTDGKFLSNIHEDFSIQITHPVPKMRFWELPKTKEAVLERKKNDIAGLQNMVQTDPNNARGQYFYGVTLENEGRIQDAIPYYEKAISIVENKDTLAWTKFRLATCVARTDNYSEAYKICVSGVADAPSQPECAWYASVMCIVLGDYSNAIAWGRIAL